MPVFMNPFQKHHVRDFPDVFVPLAHATRYPSVVADHNEKLGISSDSPVNDKEGEASVGGKYSANTVEGLRAEVDLDIAASGHDTAYDRKSKVINKAIMDIGMGPYQWQLFVLCGFGWLADNLVLQVVALTLPSLTSEFGVSSNNVRYTTCATFVGLCLGASFWGIGADLLGRRLAFNTTLFLAGVFGLAVGGGPSWVGTCGLYAALGFGVGGNLPVDGALFLEFLPSASQSLLTLLSVWWPLGQLLGSLIAWGFLSNYTCSPDLNSCDVSAPPCCSKANNWGWRYLNITVGAIIFSMFMVRFFFFHLFESPKYLLAQGRQAEAVATVHGIAYKNKRKTWLSVEVLNAIGGDPAVLDNTKLSRADIVKRTLGKFSKDRIAPLFATRRLGVMTCLIWICWATIGMGYPLFNAFLPQYFQNTGKANTAPTPNSIVYRNYAITSIVGVPGSIIAAYTVDVKYIGRKYTIAIATLITGILLFCFTISDDSNYQLTFSSLEAFFQNIMYGVLYAYTPEVFPAPNRGTGTGIASFFNRLTGLCAPIVAVHAGKVNPNAPIYASGSLILVAFIAMCCFPIETRGKQSL
ncbi:hypothetical protein HO133_009277 [Letharia lupina]|uniref:Major facilitator superfamily (MFS) profile domain-containing protein n=1 Tax=Letharia lupina TaxID=560253 RepID=A0A8H6CNM7_9LECA|nr:uncharacterized protein HO133_009277 [Letharia lupina]KAF6226411.1 hypothetical protein HO133_009277 [Letharia lupina]